MDLNNILVYNNKDKSSYQTFYRISKHLDYVNRPRQFGEVGFVLKSGNKIKSKISDRCKKAIMVGYVRNSIGDTYRMLHLDIERVTSAKDIKWTNKSYGEMIWRKKNQIVYYAASEDNETDEEKECEEGKVVMRRRKRIQSMNTAEEKVLRALKKLNVSYKPVMSGMASFGEDVAMVGGTNESYDNLDIFQEA